MDRECRGLLVGIHTPPRVALFRSVRLFDRSYPPQHNSPIRKRQIVWPLRDTDSDSEYEGLMTAPEDLSMTRRGQAGARR